MEAREKVKYILRLEKKDGVQFEIDGVQRVALFDPPNLTSRFMDWVDPFT